MLIQLLSRPVIVLLDAEAQIHCGHKHQPLGLHCRSFRHCTVHRYSLLQPLHERKGLSFFAPKKKSPNRIHTKISLIEHSRTSSSSPIFLQPITTTVLTVTLTATPTSSISNSDELRLVVCRQLGLHTTNIAQHQDGVVTVIEGKVVF